MEEEEEEEDVDVWAAEAEGITSLANRPSVKAYPRKARIYGLHSRSDFQFLFSKNSQKFKNKNCIFISFHIITYHILYTMIPKSVFLPFQRNSEP